MATRASHRARDRRARATGDMRATSSERASLLPHRDRAGETSTSDARATEDRRDAATPSKSSWRRTIALVAVAALGAGACSSAMGGGDGLASRARASLGAGWLRTTRGEDEASRRRSGARFEDAADGGLIESQYEDAGGLAAAEDARLLAEERRARQKARQRARRRAEASVGASEEEAPLGDTYVTVYEDGGKARAPRPRQTYEQRYRTVTVPVPTRVRVPMEPASVGPVRRERPAPEPAPKPAPKPVPPPRAPPTPLETEGGDLFGLGTGYSYYLKPADWAYPPRVVVDLPEGAFGDVELLARGANESPKNPGGLIMRVNGRERDLKTVVRDGDVLEIDAQAHNIIDDVRTVVLRYMWRDPGANGARKQRRGLIRLNTKRDAGGGEEQPHRWPIVEHPDTPSVTRKAPRPPSSPTNASPPRGQYVPGPIPQYVPITVNIYADMDDDDDESNKAPTVTPTPAPRQVSPPARTSPSPPPPKKPRRAPPPPTPPSPPAPANGFPPTTWPPPPAPPLVKVELRDLLAATKLVVPVTANSLVGIPSDGPLTVTGLLDYDPDNTRHRELIMFRFGWTSASANGAAALGQSGGGYEEPRFLDSSTTPPDWISIRVNGQVRALPYAAQNGDRIVMRVRAPEDSDQARVVQMVVGDLHPTVVITTANIHAPPSLEDTMNAMEPPAPPMASPPPPRELIPPPPPRVVTAAPPSPPMPPTPVETPTDDGSYYDNAGGGSTPAPTDDGSYYDNGGSTPAPADDGSYYDNGGSTPTPTPAPADDGSYYDNGGSTPTPTPAPADDGSYYDNGGSTPTPTPAPADDGSYYDNGGSTPTPTPAPVDDGSYYDTPTPTPSATPTPTPTPTPVDDGSYYDTPTPTPSATPAPADDGSYYDQPAPMVMPMPSIAPTPTPSVTPEPSATPTPSTTPDDGSYYDAPDTPTPTPTPSATPEPSASVSPEPSASASPEPSASVSPEPSASVSPEPSASVSPEPSASATPEPSASATPEPSASASPEPSATATPEPSASVSPEPSASATPEPSATVSPEPSATVSPTPAPADADDGSYLDGTPEALPSPPPPSPPPSPPPAGAPHPPSPPPSPPPQPEPEPAPVNSFTPTPNASTQSLDDAPPASDGSYDAPLATPTPTPEPPANSTSAEPSESTTPATVSPSPPSPPPPGVPPAPPASPPHPPPPRPPAPPSPPPPSSPPPPPSGAHYKNVTVEAGQTATMFTPPKSIVGLASANQQLHLTFLENHEVVTAPSVPSWCRLFVNHNMQTTLPVTVDNGYELQAIVEAPAAPGARRTVYMRYGSKQYVFDVRTRPLAHSPPPPPSAPPSPAQVVLGHVAANHPRTCTSAEAYKWSTLTKPDRSSVPTNEWCARLVGGGASANTTFEAPLCSSASGRDVIILVDASDAVGAEIFYGKMIDMLHDLYCTIEGTNSRVGLILLPGSSNPYVCDAYTSYIPLQQHTSADFHARLEALRNDTGACCGKSVPLAQGLRAAQGLFRDFGAYPANQRSVVFVTASHPSTPVEQETCLFVSLPEFRRMTRDHPFNVDHNGEKMTACHYKMRTVQVAAGELKLSGARLSVVAVPGANGHVPSSAYYAGSPWSSRCHGDGNCTFSAPYGGDRGVWGPWYTDADGAVTREYDAGAPLDCSINLRPGAPVVSKPVLTNALRVNTWNPLAYADTLAVAMCPAPACLPGKLSNATLVDGCVGDAADAWSTTKRCISDESFAACDRIIPRNDTCHAVAIQEPVVIGTVKGAPAMSTALECRQQCAGVFTPTRSKSIRVVCVHGGACDTDIIDHDPHGAYYPAHYPTNYPTTTHYPA